MTGEFTHPNDAPEGHRWTLRNGWEWRLLEVIGREIWGTFKDPVDGSWHVGIWTQQGKSSFGGEHMMHDLIDAPREHTLWVNFYSDSCCGAFAGGTYESKNEADANQAPGRTACKQITITEGEGL